MNLNAVDIESAPLKTILTPDVVTVAPEQALTTVLNLMQTRAVSSVVAIDAADRPVGIFTEQDAIKVMSAGNAISKLQMQDVMSSPVLMVEANTGYSKAYQIMTENRVRHLVVVDEEQCLIGLVSEGDFLHHMGMEYLVELKTVGSAMTGQVHVLDLEAEMSAALTLMSEEHISCVVITELGKPVGILTERDMVRLASRAQAIANLRVKTEMTTPLVTVAHALPLQLASHMMAEHNIRRLVVVGKDGGLQGILTRHDIAKSLQCSYIEYLQETLQRKSLDLKTTEARLREVEQRAFYQQLVEQISDAVLVLDVEDARILDANLQASKYLGYTHDELLQLRVLDFSLTITTQELWQDYLVPRLRESGELLIESYHRRKDGSTYPVEIKGRLVSMGLTEYVVAVARDLTERQQALDNLKQSEKRFQGLFDNAPLAYQSLDAEGRLQAVNNAWLELVGYRREQVLGRPVSDFMTPESADKLASAFPQFLAERQVDGRLFELVPKVGSKRLVSVSGQLGQDPVSGELRTHCILTDVTEQEQAQRSLRESEERFRRLFKQSPLAMVYVDHDGQLISINDQFTHVFGYTSNDMQSLDNWFMQAFPEDDYRELIQASWQRAIEEAMSGNARIKPHEYLLRSKDQQMKTVLFSGLTTEQGFLVILDDITERRQTEDRLKQAAAVFGNTSEGVMITDGQGVIQMVNSAFCKLTGYSEEEITGVPSSKLQSGRHDKAFYDQMWRSITETGNWQGEIWNRRKDGSTYPELLSISAIYDNHHRISHYVGVFADISRLKESEQKLSYLAHHDMLTGLPNRLMFQARLTHALDISQRQSKQLALLLLDLDRFKDVNDSFGHAAGDELLQQVAAMLKERLRQVDTVCRMGGDEFAIILENVQSEEDAGMLADEIIALLSRTWNLSNGCEATIGASVGISLYPSQSSDAETLLQHADAALYQAKGEGRGLFRYFSEELTFGARQRLELEARLLRALQNDELEVYYQPQIELSSGRVTGAEALVRWIDPERGVISPQAFIPLAEQTGIIKEISAVVLRKSCAQLQAWLQQGIEPIHVAVNLSAVQLRHSNIKEVIADVLEESQLPAHYLELEITESALMEREQESIDQLNELRELGVSIAIDDFGTGYSSLAYLKKFPIDVLKIDKSFVADIPQDKDDMVIASTIVAMGHSLGLKVIAEGVESEAQLAFLRSKDCHLYQGYLCSPPLPSNQFAKYLTFNA